MQQNKILVTGADGFVGKNIKTQWPQVKTLDRGIHDLNKPESLRDLLSDVEVIIHLAGVSAGTSNAPPPVAMIQKNLDLTSQLVRCIQLICKKPPKVVILSSLHVYESGHNLITENTPIGPTSTYGVIKYSQELLLAQAAQQGLLSLTIFRCTHIYGPKTKPFYNSAVATMCYQALSGKEIELYGNGEVLLDLIYVGDVIHYIQKAIERTPIWPVEIFNLASGKTVKVSEIVDCIEEIVKVPVQRKLVASQVRNYKIDLGRIHAALGAKSNIGLKEGLALQIETLQRDLGQIIPSQPENSFKK